MKILLIGGGLQGLSFGESLADKGYIIDVVSDELQIRKSCFFRKVFSTPIFGSVEKLFALIGNEHFDVIIPMGDKGVSFLSKNKDVIEKKLNTRCACPEYSLLSLVEDKHRFMAFCQQNGIPHPKTAVVTTDNREKCAVKIGFPSLIKPDYSVGARGITRVNTINELCEKLPTVLEKYGPCTLQELIENEEYYFNVMLYRDKEGKFPGYAISKIIRMYPVHAGSSSCLITVENDELLQICKDCLDKLKWVGMADFDVLQRLDNKEYKIIEINARVPASLRAAAVSGVNFPELIVLDALDQAIPSFNYKHKKKLRYLGIDLMWFLKSPKRFKAKPSWLYFFGKNLYYQDIYKKDPSTWWTWIVEGIIKINNRNKKIR